MERINQSNVMIEIRCDGCHRCCQSPFNPVLLPEEEKKFKKSSRRIETPGRIMFVLDKNSKGNCIFLNEKTGRCNIYSNRPLECILYPFLLDFKKNPVDVKLDKRVCPKLDSLVFNKEVITESVRKINFQKEWIDGYEELGDF